MPLAALLARRGGMIFVAQSVRCPCLGNPECKLCAGAEFYRYEPGPRGWMPFSCPTCQGTGSLPGENGTTRPCITCHGARNIDPARPPSAPGTRGWLRNSWRFLFGG
jgi:hypothetical protein